MQENDSSQRPGKNQILEQNPQPHKEPGPFRQRDCETHDDELTPVEQRHRIESLDLLCGIALLGIMVVNIQSFAMIKSAYLNPTSGGGLTGIHYGVWWATHVFFDQKMMTIFSLLFGAGIAMTYRRTVHAGRSHAALHFCRMISLMVIGLLHAYLVWYGDILFLYSVCGMVVFLARRWNPKAQVALGALMLMVPIMLNGFFQ